MRNNIGIYHLFEGCENTKKKFLEWCKNNDELCDYDLEHIEIDLYMPAINNTDRYFHFHKGNLIDFIEDSGFYFDLIRSSRDEGTVHIKNIGGSIIRFTFDKGKEKAIQEAVKKCLKLIENGQ